MLQKIQQLSKKLLKSKMGISIAGAAVLGLALILLIPPVIRDNRLQNLLRLGEQYLNEMSYERAILTFNEIIQIDPKQVEAYSGLHEAYMGIGDTKNAILSLTDGMKKVKSENVDGLKALLSAHGEDPGSWDEMRIVINVLVAERLELPMLDDILKEMGISIIRQAGERGEWETVKEIFDILQKAFPDDPELDGKIKEMIRKFLQKQIEQTDPDSARETIIILREIFFSSPPVLEEIEAAHRRFEAEEEKRRQEEEEQRAPQVQWHLDPNFEFDDIRPINEHGSRVEKGGKYGIMDYDGNLLWDTQYGQIIFYDLDSVYIGDDRGNPKTIIALDEIAADEEFHLLSDGGWDFGKGHALDCYYMDIESGKVLQSWGNEIFHPFTGFAEGVRIEKTDEVNRYRIVEYTGLYAFCIADQKNSFRVTRNVYGDLRTYDYSTYEVRWKTDFEFMNVKGYEHDINDICIAQGLDEAWNYYKYADGQFLRIHSAEPVFERPEQFALQSDEEMMAGRNGFEPMPYDFTACQVRRSSGDYTQINVAAVKSGEKWGYISEDGETMVPFIYEEARPFFGEYAWVKQNGRWGVIVLTKDYPS